MSAPEFAIVGIGASAGGIDAFHSFFEHLPADSGLAVVILLHLPARGNSMLSEILSRWTPMPIIKVTARTELKPNHVYVPEPHSLVTFEEGHLNVEKANGDDARIFRPIDLFFDSLGAGLRDRAVGIVLSGTGSD